MQELYHRLLTDLRALGIREKFTLELKPYSKTFFGRYDPNTRKITVYVYQDETCLRMYPYEDILLTTIHEAVHCIQWSSDNFVRLKGVMHDPEFYRLYNEYADRARALFLLREVKNDTIHIPRIFQSPTLCGQYC